MSELQEDQGDETFEETGLGQRAPELGKFTSAATWRIILKRFAKNQAALVGLMLIGFFLLLAVISFIDDFLYNGFWFFEGFGFGLLPYGPNDTFAGGASAYEPPSLDHFFGTDNVGRDIFVRIIYGARISILVGFISVTVSLTIGTLLGLVAGYFGGKLDSAISMLLETLLAFPAILLALAILSAMGSSLINAMLAVGIVYIPYYARIVRGQTLVEKNLTYVEAAKILGASSSRILSKHILPNILGTIVVYSTLGIGTAILEVAALSFLGLGALPPTAEWGAMIADGRKYFANATHLVFFPGMMILFIVMSFNLVGDGLREAIDPRFKR